MNSSDEAPSTAPEPFIHDPTFLMSSAVVPSFPLLPSAGSREPIRVLHVIDGAHYSGAERVQDLLAERLPEFGFEVGFACLKPDRFPAMRRSQRAPLEKVPSSSNFDFRAAGKVCDIVRRGNYRIIHAHTPRSCMIARLAAMLCGRPLVYHVHGPAGEGSTHLWSNRVNTWIERLGLTGVSQLIAVSDSLAQHMCGLGYDPNRIAIVPNGVPCNSKPSHRDAPRENWTLGTIALFRPRKGTEVLIDALAALRPAAKGSTCSFALSVLSKPRPMRQL
jgi:glycosyltransferase involved in cell wall biosynthesis